MTPQIVIIVIVAAVAGYVFGILDRIVTSSLRKKKDETKPAPAPVQAPQDANRPGEQTVLKVTNDVDLKWHVELDGKRLDKPEEMSQEQRQRAVSVVVQMRPWLDARAAAASAPVQAPATPIPATATPAAPAPTLGPTPAPVPQPRPVTAPQPVPVKTPAKQGDLRLNPMRGLTSMVSKDVKAPPKKSLTLVGMIDDVLQTRLPGTAYENAGIHLEDGPLGEVIVVVGAQTFKGIDAVPDPEIRSLIKAAIAEWEKK